MALEDEKIYGIIHAMPNEVARNILKGGKDVFVKYLNYEPTKKTPVRLTEGMKLFIYVSKSTKSVVGEAKIKKIHYLKISDILSKFGERTMINKKDLKKYSGDRDKKHAQVLELKKINLYPNEVKVLIPITMSGAYVTESNINKVFGDKII